MTEISRLEAVVTADTSAASRDLQAFGGTMDQTAAKGGGLTGMLGNIASTAAGFVIGQGLLQLPGLLMSSVGAAQDSAKNVAQLNAVIASTQGVAGVSAQAAQDLATKWMGLANVDDDVVLGAENMLLTFTNIGSNIFPDATEATLNMSQALGQDATQSAVMLGKALQDPITGATALRRVGVALTDEQQDMIKAFVESGDLLSAQKIILNELKTEFGGTAEAIGKAKGPIEAVKVQFGEFQETLGAAVIPALAALGSSALTAFQAFSDSGGLATAMNIITASVTGAAGFITGAFRAIGQAANSELGQKVIGAVEIIQGAISGLLAGDFPVFIQTLEDGFGIDLGPVVAAWNILTRAWQMAGEALQTFAQALRGDWAPDPNRIAPFTLAIGIAGVAIRTLSGIVTQVLSGDIAGALTAFGTLLQTTGAQLAPIFTEWGRQFIAWIAPMIPPFLAALADLAARFTVWIGEQAPLIAAQLLLWARQFVDWIQPMIPPFLVALAGLAVRFLGWIVETGPTILAQLSEWAKQFVAWVAPMIPPFLVEVGKILIAIGDWIVTTAAPAILTKLATWGQSFVDWVVPASLLMVTELAKMLTALAVWLTGDGKKGADQAAIDGWGNVFKDWIPTAVANMTGPGGLDSVLTAYGTWVGNSLKQWQSASTVIGRAIIEGVIEGLGEANPLLKRALQSIIGQGASAANSAGSIWRPSTGGGGSVSGVDVDAAARSQGISPALLRSLIQNESGGNQGALSPAGAIGLTQLMPGTAAGLGVNPYDAQQNVEGGARYLRQMLDQFGGDVERALIAYNAGPAGGAPSESIDYARNVIAAAGGMSAVLDSMDPAASGAAAGLGAMNTILETMDPNMTAVAAQTSAVADGLTPLTSGLTDATTQTNALTTAARSGAASEAALTTAGNAKTSMVTTQAGALGTTATAAHGLAAANTAATSAEAIHAASVAALISGFNAAADASGVVATGVDTAAAATGLAATSALGLAASHLSLSDQLLGSTNPAVAAVTQGISLATTATGLAAQGALDLATTLITSTTPAIDDQTRAVTGTMTADILRREQAAITMQLMNEGVTKAELAHTAALFDAALKTGDLREAQRLLNLENQLAADLLTVTVTPAIQTQVDTVLKAIKADQEWNIALRENEKALGMVQSTARVTTGVMGSMSEAMVAAYKPVNKLAQAYDELADSINDAVKAAAKMVGSAANDAMNNAFRIAGKASGGPVSGNMTYLVGERGPELFTPSTSGRITPNEQLSLGGPSPIVINIGTVDSAERVREIEAAVRNALQFGNGRRLGL